ncbi:unnamed protein product [Lymnaea stagnalis]|uniref:Uncharacterized protein n=1 Tax=Lymnaea stagnalis TaxID=6523 RepID=A0AAV2IF86_LYMST
MSQKSQTQAVFIADIMSWSRETCLQNLNIVLPKVIIDFEKSAAYIEEAIDLLRIICQSLMPCVPLEHLEDQVFSKICKSICGYTDSIIDKILVHMRSQLQGSSQELKLVVTECLEWLVSIGQCLELCAKCAIGVANDVELSCVQSLPSCIVHLLVQAYSHCKTSNDLYGDFLEQVSESLSTLFKMAHSLQMSLLTLLDRLCISGAHLEEHVTVLCSVCTGLYNICSVVTSLDVKLVISLWKGISKLCNQHLSLLQDRFDVSPLLNFLCDEIRQGYLYLFHLCPASSPNLLSQGDDKAFNKLVKILGFQMKVMVALLRDFSAYLDNCEDNILELLMCFLRYLPPSVYSKSISNGQESVIRNQLVNAAVPIIGHLVANRVFRLGLTKKTPAETVPEDHLPKLLLQLMVLDKLPTLEVDVMDYWLTPVNHSENIPTLGLLAAIFHSVQLCEVEMRIPVMLPGVMVSGKPERKVSLYEHVAIHICGYIGACLARHFNVTECILLENVLHGSHVSSLLATDCWCFLSRYGTAGLCQDHVKRLVGLYKEIQLRGSTKSNRKAQFRLECLLQRLLKLMTSEHQAALVELIPPDRDPAFWLAMSPDSPQSNLPKVVHQKLVTWGMDVLQASSGKSADIFQAVEFFTKLLSNNSSEPCLAPHQQAILLEFTCKMWAQLVKSPEIKAKIREQLLTRLMPLTRCFVSLMETSDILQVLIVIQGYLIPACPVALSLSIIEFLTGFRTLRMAPSFQQSQVLEKMAKTFHHMMCHPHPLVHHMALSAFSDFATHTSHEEAIPACIMENKWLQGRVEHFLNKIPHQSTQSFILLDYLRDQMKEEDVTVSQEHSNNLTETHSNVDGETDGNERPSKKPRYMDESSHDKSTTVDICNSSTASCAADQALSPNFQAILTQLTDLADRLEQECHRSTPPTHFIATTKLALTRIYDCISDDKSWFDRLS